MTRSTKFYGAIAILLGVALAVFAFTKYFRPAVGEGQQATSGAKLFDDPQQAADNLVKAAASFDVGALTEIFGTEGEDIVFSGEFPQDRKHATDFAAEAHKKMSVS